MSGSELKTLVEELHDGETMSNSLFVSLVNQKKNMLESLRPWVILRKVDSSLTVLGADGITNFKTLPTGFRVPFLRKRTNGKKTAIVLRTGNNIRYVDQIPFGTEQEHKDDIDYFFIDRANNRFAFTGTRDQTYTIYLNYIGTSTYLAVATIATWSWDFPSEHHPLLAFKIATTNKAGIDYDEINARMAQSHGIDAEEMMRSMIFWDDALQRAELSV